MMLGDGDTAPLLPFPPAPSSLPLSRDCVPPVTSRGAWKPSLSPLVWQSSCHWDSVAQDSSHHLAAQISVAAASAPQGAVQDAEAEMSNLNFILPAVGSHWGRCSRGKSII